MNGAPAKPISGVLAELLDGLRRTACGDRGEGRGVELLAGPSTSAGVRIGDESTGPRPGTISTVHTGELDRHDDVAEEDARVDAVTADRLQRDLARQVGREAGVEHGGADAQLAVLGKRAPRLAHEPHRQRLGPVAAQGTDQR